MCLEQPTLNRVIVGCANRYKKQMFLVQFKGHEIHMLLTHHVKKALKGHSTDFFYYTPGKEWSGVGV